MVLMITELYENLLMAKRPQWQSG